jgi:hypothetical protein
MERAGRWHAEGEGLEQYLALSSGGAWAELVRYDGIRTNERRFAEHRCLWQFRVAADGIADLSTFDNWEACGLDPAIAVGDHAASQVLASELRRARYRGVLSPSAALDVAGAVNLTLFGGRVEHPIEGQPLPDEPVGGGRRRMGTDEDAAVRESCSGCRPTCALRSRTCADSRWPTSATCVRSQARGLRKKCSNTVLEHCHGGTSSSC